MGTFARPAAKMLRACLSVKMNRYNIKNAISSLYTLVFKYRYYGIHLFDWYNRGSLMAYHTRTFCNEKEPKIPGAKGDREARSHYHKG